MSVILTFCSIGGGPNIIAPVHRLLGVPGHDPVVDPVDVHIQQLIQQLYGQHILLGTSIQIHLNLDEIVAGLDWTSCSID